MLSWAWRIHACLSEASGCSRPQHPLLFFRSPSPVTGHQSEDLHSWWLSAEYCVNKVLSTAHHFLKA